MSSINSIFRALSDGYELSTKQIREKYKVSNPRDLVYRLRRSGYPVNLVFRRSNGKKTRKYILNSTERAASTYTVAKV